MDKPFLSQEEIDALLRGSGLEVKENSSAIEENDEILTPEEKDILCEIGNISAGASSTALSELLRQKVIINIPTIWVTTLKDLHESFQTPYIAVEVNYTTGIEGKNLFIVKMDDAAVIADIMMGGTGENVSSQMDEITMSAVSEAMNQMIGFSATSMSELFRKTVEISPPTITTINVKEDRDNYIWDPEQKIIIISFKLKVGEILQSEIMLLMNPEVAKQQVSYLTSASYDQAAVSSTPIEAEEQHLLPAATENPSDKKPELSESQKIRTNNDNYRNLDLILDVPLRLSVMLGRTKRNISDVLGFNLGTIIELERLADEPVDILVNDTLIAKGEVVVVNEYFGVRITSIISPENRVRNLGKDIIE